MIQVFLSFLLGIGVGSYFTVKSINTNPRPVIEQSNPQSCMNWWFNEDKAVVHNTIQSFCRRKIK